MGLKINSMIMTEEYTADQVKGFCIIDFEDVWTHESIATALK